MGVRQACGSLLFLLSILACSDPTGARSCGEARSLDPSLRLPPVTGAQNTDDQWAAIARQVPGGWGGALLVNGQPTIYLVHPEKRDEAVAALYAFGVGQPAFDVRLSAVLQGRWDFAQLYDWYRYINVQARTVSGLYSTDIDEAQNRLHYGVDSGAVRQFEGVLQTLDLPCDLVTVEASGPAVPD
jgi:hypothetical protein